MATAPSPDPKAGLFETMLVAGGRPVEFDAHLARLDAGLDGLFGERAPRGARELARDRARGIHLGRLRLTVAPDRAGRLQAEITAAEVDPALVFPLPERAVDLRSLIVDGGLGAHKWADRTLLDEAEATAPAGSVPLLLDSDGTVLEASRASIFAASDGVLRTPPTDGRILPGIARERAIEVAERAGVEVREARLDLDDLPAADEVFLTGSVRGVEPVGSIDGAARTAGGRLSARLAAGLSRRWLG